MRAKFIKLSLIAGPIVYLSKQLTLKHCWCVSHVLKKSIIFINCCKENPIILCQACLWAITDWPWLVPRQTKRVDQNDVQWFFETALQSKRATWYDSSLIIPKALCQREVQALIIIFIQVDSFELYGNNTLKSLHALKFLLGLDWKR